jgi:hypothetical protein
VSYKEVNNVEESSSILQNMFNECSTSSLNEFDIEVVESHPHAAWKLLNITAGQVYSDLSMFHLKFVSRVIIKKSMSQFQNNYDTTQTISLLNPKQIQVEANKHHTQYLHLGCIRRHKCSCP